MRQSLKETKKIFKPLFRRLSREGKDRYDLLEAAFFAYAHGNPLIDKIFWGRLAYVQDHIFERDFRTILDFGTGSGILSYALAKENLSVTATDLDPRPREEIARHVPFPSVVNFINPGDLKTEKFRNRFDAVLALDVLEHDDDVASQIAFLERILAPGGEIIVSGPTENVLYKIGRRLAGKEFTGDYHKTDIHDIEQTFRMLGWHVKRIKVIHPILPLFNIFSASRRN